MHSFNLIRASDHNELFHKAATHIFAELPAINKDSIVVGLPGGRSVGPLLEALLKQADDISEETWSRLHFFMLDERLVPIESSESNFSVVKPYLASLVAKGLISESQIHPFEFKRDDIKGSIANYLTELGRFGGAFDIVVLGVGEDGHVAALFPDHAALDDARIGFTEFDGSPKPPPKRMTVTLPLLRLAKVAVVLFLGEAKRAAFERFLDNDLKLEKCPVKIVRAIPNSYVVTDLAP